MIGRLASILVLATALASCREPMSDRGPLDDVAARGERALSVVSGDDDGYDESVNPYERGVHDGLTGADFDQDERSEAYARGYDAGLSERRRERRRQEVGDRAREQRRAAELAREDLRAAPAAGRAPPDARVAEGPQPYRRVGTSFNATGEARQPPRDGLGACADQTEAMFGLPEGSAAAVSSRARENGGYLVDVRAGPRQTVCVLTAEGEVRSVDER